MARSLNFQMDKHWVLVKAAGVFEKAVQSMQHHSTHGITSIVELYLLWGA